MVFRHAVVFAESELAFALVAEEAHFLFAEPAAGVVDLGLFAAGRFFARWLNFRLGGAETAAAQEVGGQTPVKLQARPAQLRLAFELHFPFVLFHVLHLNFFLIRPDRPPLILAHFLIIGQ